MEVTFQFLKGKRNEWAGAREAVPGSGAQPSPLHAEPWPCGSKPGGPRSGRAPWGWGLRPLPPPGTLGLGLALSPTFARLDGRPQEVRAKGFMQCLA